MKRNAFTLVEFLLGLMILSLIASGLYGVFYGAFRFDHAARKIHAGARDIRLGLDVLSRELESALPYPQIVDGQVVAFEGTPERIMFYLRRPSGIERVEYFSGEMGRDAGAGKDGLYLLRRWQSLPDFWQQKAGSREVMAVSGGLAAKGAEFSFGRIDVRGRMEFYNIWKKAFLPDVVRVRYPLTDSGRPAVTLDIFPVVKTLDPEGSL